MKLLRSSKRRSAKVTVDTGHLSGKWNGAAVTSGTTNAHESGGTPRRDDNQAGNRPRQTRRVSQSLGGRHCRVTVARLPLESAQYPVQAPSIRDALQLELAGVLEQKPRAGGQVPHGLRREDL
jgi:hypothetical protein